MTFSAKDGMLNAEITAVDIAGLDIDHPRENDVVEFVSVNITADAMEITVRVTP